jgi:uncharacterized repeat protein (TIGR01451 family)
MGCADPRTVAECLLSVLKRENVLSGLKAKSAFGSLIVLAMMAVFAAPAWAQSLSISENAPKRVKVGQVFTYTVNVTNTGPATAPDVSVLTTIEHPEETFVSANSTAGTCGFEEHGSFGSVKCELGDIGPNEQRTAQVQIVPTAEARKLGSLFHLATASTGAPFFSFTNSNGVSVTVEARQKPRHKHKDERNHRHQGHIRR